MWHSLIARFSSQEEGAVTVDWVVLTAAILILGALVATSISRGAISLSEETGATLGAAEVPEIDFAG